MDKETNNTGESILGPVTGIASLLISALGLLEISKMDAPFKDLLFIAVVAFLIISFVCIISKQNILAACIVILVTIFYLYAIFELPSTDGGDNGVETSPQIDTAEPSVINPEPSKPKETEQSKPKETEPPKPKETEEKVEINYFIYSVDNAGETAKLAISGETAGMKPQWRSSDADIVKVDPSGEITAIGSGDASIYAEIQYEGRQYYSKIEISVDLVPINTATYTLKYLESLPDGLDQGSDQYRNMVEYHDLYATEVDALASINHVDYTPDGDPVKIGYVYYHWCAGDYNDPNLFVVETHMNEPAPYCYNHNRTSSYEKGPYKKSNGQIVDLNKFTCFYSEKESEYEECSDDSKCWWIDSSSICNDSYWYWKIPVYKTEYTGYDTAFTITVKG